MIDFVVSQVQAQQLVVSKEQLRYHHGTIGLDFVQIEVQHLQVAALLQSLGQVLGSLTLNRIALQVEAQKTRCF